MMSFPTGRMKDAEKTVGNMIDKLKTAFIGSIDSEE
jgi:hypothetical protein